MVAIWIWWQKDGAPCNVIDHNMRYLDRKFEDRVVSRTVIRGHDWPARSPDLKPLDFYLGDSWNPKYTHPKPRDLNELKLVLEREIARVNVDICREGDHSYGCTEMYCEFWGHLEWKDHKHVCVSIFYIILDKL